MYSNERSFDLELLLHYCIILLVQSQGFDNKSFTITFDQVEMIWPFAQHNGLYKA